jgi:hypothetical protein
MEWSVTNLVIQIITGMVGGHAAAVASHEYSFGRSAIPSPGQLEEL